MPSTINDLPYEILSAVLEEAAALNIKDGVQYTYGLSQAPEPLQDARMQRVVRGQVSPDALRWNATQSIRQVRRQWHDWAAEYALENLQISRWRGSERWMQSRTLDIIHSRHSSLAVYRDPYHSLRKTALLFNGSPSLASCVRKIWFHGYYTAETNAMVFDILRNCGNLDFITLPWTALRYGSADDWSYLLGCNRAGRSISSLELLAVDLKQSQMSNPANQVNRKPLHSSKVNFGGLRRLKIFGHSNFMPLTDEDLVAISQTAGNLREIHVTGTATLTIDGIGALADSSDETLEVLEHSPLAADGFEHPDPTISHSRQDHLCRKVLRCPRLSDLSLSLPAICPDLFADPSVKWCGDVQIRTGTVCGHHPLSLKISEKAQARFWCVLDRARALMLSREQGGTQINIEIFVDGWIFEPRRLLVHGNLQMGESLSDGSWPHAKMPSSKGPYGQTGLYGKAGPYQSVSEDAFREGLKRRYVSF